MPKMKMQGFFLLVVSQNVLSCPTSAGNINYMFKLRLKKEKWFCLMSKVLNYTKKKISITLQTGKKLQQVTRCQTDKQGRYIYSRMSGIKEWREPGVDNA